MNVLLLEALLRYGPQFVLELIDLFKKTEPTLDDWAALCQRALAKSYDDYVRRPAGGSDIAVATGPSATT